MSAFGRMAAADYVRGLLGRKKRKYANEKVRDAGGEVIADSKLEHRRQQDLRLLEKAGAIRELRFHPKYVLVPAIKSEVTGTVLERAATYEADAEYVDVATGERIVEDSKVGITEKNGLFVLKRKLMRHLYGVRVRIHKEG